MFEFPWLQAARRRFGTKDQPVGAYQRIEVDSAASIIADDLRRQREREERAAEMRAFCQPGDRFEVLGIVYVCALISGDGSMYARSNVKGQLDSVHFTIDELPMLQAELARSIEHDRDLAASADLLRSAGYLVVADGLEVVGQ